MRYSRSLFCGLLLASLAVLVACDVSGTRYNIPDNTLAGPAPFTGLVLWDDSGDMAEYKDAVSLEFRYFRYDEVASGSPGAWTFDWTAVDEFLQTAAGRGHHGILRFKDTDPAFSTPGVPVSVRGTVRTALYDEGIPGSMPLTVRFPDWSQAHLGDFMVAFWQAYGDHLAASSPSPAFIEMGFGFWAEYHLDFDNLSSISDPAVVSPATALGRIFPDKALQLRILEAARVALGGVPWLISIDASNDEYAPSELATGDQSFGLFDDSFLCAGGNAGSWEAWTGVPSGPRGGEISYYTEEDQQLALSADGPHGVDLASAARAHGLSFLIGNDQPLYRNPAEIAAAGKSLGYQFVLRSAVFGSARTTVTIANTGVAPLYVDAFPALGGTRSATSLKGLGPGEERVFDIPAAGSGADFRLDCDRLVAGQSIPWTGVQGRGEN